MQHPDEILYGFVFSRIDIYNLLYYNGIKQDKFSSFAIRRKEK